MKSNELKEKMKQDIEVKTINAACKFCGQIECLEVPYLWSDEDADEVVTEQCGCYEAKAYYHKKKMIEAANKTINRMFSSDKTNLSEECVDILKAAAVQIANDDIDSLSIKCGKEKATVKATSKGTIKVTKEIKTTDTQEA